MCVCLFVCLFVSRKGPFTITTWAQVIGSVAWFIMRSTAVLPASFTHHRHVSYAVCILLNNSSLSSQQGYPAYISFTGDSKGEQSDYVIPVECDTSAPQHGAAAGYRRSVSTMLLGCWSLNEDNHRQPL